MTPAQLDSLLRSHDRVQRGKGETRREGSIADLTRLAATPVGG